MITDAKKRRLRQSGQSMLEFAILLPILVILFQILIEAESAISTAIVNQKYARSTLEYLFFNHRQYLEFDRYAKSAATGDYFRRYWIGVDDKTLFNVAANDVKPRAPERKIGRGAKIAEDDVAGVEYPEIEKRKNIRIRSTAFTCMPPMSVNPNGLLSEGNMRESTFTGDYSYCPSSQPQY